jgi:type I site-specific restriction endonuclease
VDLGPVWTGAENHAPNGIRSPDLSARNESLYRLSYPAQQYNNNNNNKNNKPVITGETGTISKSFRKYVSTIPGNHELQKTAILSTAHILRKVLM